ncbi:Hypothetical protein PP7435_CHR1-0278 [Komagataella phaffii CBS 7435]|nr:GQ67_02536T0 [Komagataella phaffii]AOA65438.1 GQ68_02712T0 [Komagataella phaffii GS115]CAH2445993.1 Hypothetical protein BQ9382_C1-1440 [Komagataella phaffii CBS 7435]CCA36439.1 Hypothetical protein PP7435_CHR1-0278 [Komagataella phaffii CBS 7435]
MKPDLYKPSSFNPYMKEYTLKEWDTSKFGSKWQQIYHRKMVQPAKKYHSLMTLLGFLLALLTHCIMYLSFYQMTAFLALFRCFMSLTITCIIFSASIKYQEKIYHNFNYFSSIFLEEYITFTEQLMEEYNIDSSALLNLEYISDRNSTADISLGSIIQLWQSPSVYDSYLLCEALDHEDSFSDIWIDSLFLRSLNTGCLFNISLDMAYFVTSSACLLVHLALLNFPAVKFVPSMEIFYLDIASSTLVLLLCNYLNWEVWNTLGDKKRQYCDLV